MQRFDAESVLYKYNAWIERTHSICYVVSNFISQFYLTNKQSTIMLKNK
jgi:hypothetical protein